MDRPALESTLRQAGCTRIVERRDPAGTHYPPHHHPWDLILVVMEGQVTLRMGSHTQTAEPGDHLFIHAGRRHEVTIGPNGAVYLHAEKPTKHAIA